MCTPGKKGVFQERRGVHLERRGGAIPLLSWSIPLNCTPLLSRCTHPASPSTVHFIEGILSFDLYTWKERGCSRKKEGCTLPCRHVCLTIQMCMPYHADTSTYHHPQHPPLLCKRQFLYIIILLTYPLFREYVPTSLHVVEQQMCTLYRLCNSIPANVCKL